MKNNNQINFVIAILGLGIALGSLAAVIDFPSFWIFAVGLAMVLIGILRAIGHLEDNSDIRPGKNGKEKMGFAIR
ncbi:MAG: hypothetical protein JW806_05670 [Sedimentisphaerales bacterium]|nr:hypothetical protein [Sedimentisphaerales bacterium]